MRKSRDLTSGPGLSFISSATRRNEEQRKIWWMNSIRPPDAYYSFLKHFYTHSPSPFPGEELKIET